MVEKLSMDASQIWVNAGTETLLGGVEASKVKCSFSCTLGI